MDIFAKAKFNRKVKRTNHLNLQKNLREKLFRRRSGLDYAIGAQTCIMASHSITKHEMCSEISQTKPYGNNKREEESEEPYLKEKEALRRSRSLSLSLFGLWLLYKRQALNKNETEATAI